MTDHEQARRLLNRLTARKRQCVRLLVTGYTSNEAIAEQIGTSTQVIKNYFSEIFDVFGVWDRVELALYVVRNPEIERLLSEQV